MDIWEANSISTAYTPHPCKGTGLTACTGTDCGDGDDRYNGVCDKDGCDFNSYRMGVKNFYGPGASEELVELVQQRKVYKNAESKISGATGNSITDTFCKNQKTAFGDNNSFAELGGLNAMGSSLARGHVLVMSLWDDHAVNMLWLDSTYPTDADPSKPGIARGTCSTSSGKLLLPSALLSSRLRCAEEDRGCLLSGVYILLLFLSLWGWKGAREVARKGVYRAFA